MAGVQAFSQPVSGDVGGRGNLQRALAASGSALEEASAQVPSTSLQSNHTRLGSKCLSQPQKRHHTVAQCPGLVAVGLRRGIGAQYGSPKLPFLPCCRTHIKAHWLAVRSFNYHQHDYCIWHKDMLYSC